MSDLDMVDKLDSKWLREACKRAESVFDALRSDREDLSDDVVAILTLAAILDFGITALCQSLGRE